MLDSKFVMHMGDGQPRPPKGVPLILSSLGPPADEPGYMMPLWDDDDLLTLVLKEMCEGALYDFAAFGIPGPHMAKAKNDNWLKVYGWLCVTSKRISRLVRLDAVWSLATQNRWRLHLKEKEWLEDARETERARRAQTAPGAPPTQIWQNLYRIREAELRKELPVFFMHTNLQLAKPFGIHFFEPRYRRLISTAVAMAPITPEKVPLFLYAKAEPNEGQVMYLCEAHCVTRYTDGRADLYVLPVTRVMAHTVKVETFDPRCPPLYWAQVEVMPMANVAERDGLARALGIVRSRLVDIEKERIQQAAAAADQLGGAGAEDADLENDEEESEEEGEEESEEEGEGDADAELGDQMEESES